MPTTPESKVFFGSLAVTPEEKKRLVHDLFDPIAANYDLADTLLSAGLDARWRRKAVGFLGLRPGQRILDLCGGTAGLAMLAARAVSPGGRAVVYDFNLAMMTVGRRRVRRLPPADKIQFVRGDAEDIGFCAGSVDAVTIGFGLRNLARPERGLGEIHRVLKPGGKLMVLEFSVPVNPVVRGLYHFYSFNMMPVMAGAICGASGPFRYLAKSIRVFPPPDEIASMIRRAGFSDVIFHRLTDGIAVAYIGRKPENPVDIPSRPLEDP
jgi:demethylmenaquinone methyltransferase / 2-methoxy-6-polyprenyl-1,4-benzoquinol methylase